MPNEVRILEFAKLARIMVGSVFVVLAGVATAVLLVDGADEVSDWWREQ